MLGWLAVAVSLLLHAFVVFCFSDGRDALSAVAVFPIWLWALVGTLPAALAVPMLRSRWPLALGLLWAITAVVGADERRSLARGLAPTLEEARPPAPAGGGKVLRVATLNCADRNTDAMREVGRFNPDIVFIQEAPSGAGLKAFAEEMFGDAGSTVGAWTCAIVARGQLSAPRRVLYEHGIAATLRLPDGVEIELMSIHLEHATTRWDLWRRSCWKEHRDTHRIRRGQLRELLAHLEADAGDRPKIFGGDFNSPPTSNLFDAIPDSYTNAFAAAGRGLGNTFINRLPVLRIDHIYTGPTFEVVDARSARTTHSDHRMVVCDIVLPARGG